MINENEDESRRQSTNINADEQMDEIDDQMRQLELNAPPPPPPQTTTIVQYNGGPVPQVVYDQFGRQYTTSIISPTTPTMMQSPASPNTPPPIIVWTSTPPSTPFAPVNPYMMPTTPITMNSFAPPNPTSPGMIIYQGGPPPQQQIPDRNYLPMIMAPPPPPTNVAVEQRQQIQCEMGIPNDGSEYEPPATSTPVPTPTPAQYEPPTSIPPAHHTPGAMVYEGGPPQPPPQYYTTSPQYYQGSPFVMTPAPSAPPPTAIVGNQQQFGFETEQPRNVFQYGPSAIPTPMMPMTPMTPIPQLVPMHRYPTPTPTPPFTIMGYTHTAFRYPSPNDTNMMMAQPSGGRGGMARSPMYYGAQSMMPTMAEGDFYESDRQEGGRRQWNEGRRAPKRGNDGGCSFCKRNGESREYFSSHQLRDPNGRVECPILRAFECPYCGATGDDSHTASYCPNQPPDCKSFSRIKLNRTATGRIRNSKK